ncbi:MAG: nuclear transport factor 2 family protein [Anaerolineaceae bacterium]|nr:MAG: nuclear transport factor 2 family protein [Anaerolineaceae bacterium]
MARVFYTFFDALNSGDVDLAMSVVADDAEICFQTCKNTPESIHQMLQIMLNNSYRHEVVISRIEGDTIYFQHIVYYSKALLLRGEDIMVIQDGKIKKLRGL